jgi:hypothetical protein
MEQATPATTTTPLTPAPKGTVSLWAGIIVAPLMWACQLQLAYALVPWIGGHGKHFLLHVITAFFFIGTIVCLWLCWREWASVKKHTEREHHIARAAFLSMLGMTSSALFALVILAQGIASFFLDARWN